jgi:hypothetical protein
MSVLKLRFEIERALRDFTAAHGIVSERPMSIRIVLEELKQHGVAPPSTDRFLETLTVMNKAVHGLKADAKDLAQAISIGTELLAELSASTS